MTSPSSIGEYPQVSSRHYKPTRDAPSTPPPKIKPTRDVPIPTELVRCVSSYRYDRSDHLSLEDLEIQYFDYLPVYQSKISSYEHSDYIADGCFGIVVLSLLHPKSLEFIKRSKRKERKIGLKFTSGSVREKRRTFSFTSSPIIEEIEPVGTTTEKNSSRKSKKTRKKKGGLSGLKKKSQAIVDKISHKHSKKDKDQVDTDQSSRMNPKGRMTMTRKKRVAFDSSDDTFQDTDEDSVSMSVSEIFTDDDSTTIDTTDFSSIPIAPIEGLLRTESGDMWIKFKTEEPVTKVKHLLKMFLQKMPKYSKLHFNLVKSPVFSEYLLSLENDLFRKAFSFSVLNRLEGQNTYNQILSNDNVTPGLKQFFEVLGARLIRLTGWKGFNGELSTKMLAEDGEESYYVEYEGHEIMFCVGPMLPAETIGDGDDAVISRTNKIEQNTVLILYDECIYPVDPNIFQHQMVQIILVIRKVIEDPPQYMISILSKEGVLEHKPLFSLETLLEPDIFSPVLLTKLLNSNRASMSTFPFVSQLIKKKKFKLEQLYQQFLELD